jgi:hypothetical protein
MQALKIGNIKKSTKTTANPTFICSWQSSEYIEPTADQRLSGHRWAITTPPGQYQSSGQMIGRLYRGEQNWPGEAVQDIYNFIRRGIGAVFIRI